MAYKFQIGAARMSGSLVQEGALDVYDDDGNAKLQITKTGVVSGSNQMHIVGAASFGAAIAATGSITAGTSFVIGSADLNETDLEKLDGITNGAGAANKALVLDGNADVASGLRSVTGSGDIKVANVHATSAMFSAGAITAGGNVTAVGSFIIGSADMSEADLEKLDGITNGAGAANKALVLDASADIASGLRSMTGSGDARFANFHASAAGYFPAVSGSGALTMGALAGTSLALQSGGISAAGAIAGASSIDGSGDLTMGTITMTGFSVDADGDTVVKSLSGSAGLEMVGAAVLGSSLAVSGTVQLAGVADTAMAVGSDSFYFLDADGLMKRDTMADYATAIAGDGLAASSGILAVGVDDSTIETNSDALRIKDDGVTGAKLNDDVISAQTELASDGLAAADELMISDGGTLKKIGVDNLMKDGPGLLAAAAIDVAADHFMFLDGGATGDAVTESIADLVTAMAATGLGAGSGQLFLDLNELGDAAVASGDKFAFVDGTDNTSKLESIDDIATLFAGNGLSAASAVLALDLNELTAAAVSVANDSIAIIDADDSNGTKKESISDLVDAMAGAGLSAASGVLSVTGNDVALKADGDTLAEGYNYFASASSNVTVSLPASPTVGDVVTVKAGDLTSGANLIINRQGSHTVDGEEAIRIESPFGAVSMVYVVANNWRIV